MENFLFSLSLAWCPLSPELLRLQLSEHGPSAPIGHWVAVSGHGQGELLPLFSLPPSTLHPLPFACCPLPPAPPLSALASPVPPALERFWAPGSELQMDSSPPQLPGLGFPFFIYLFDYCSPDSSYLLFIFVGLCLFVFLYCHFIDVLGVKRKACAQSTRFNQRSKTFHFYCLNIIQLRISPPHLSPQLSLLNL